MTPTDPAPGNRLLAALGPEDRGRIAPHLERVELRRGVVLHEPRGELAEVWFPEGCVISVVVVVRDGGLAEGAVVGREGAAGLVDALGSRRASARCLVQVPGPAFRPEPDRPAAAHEASPILRRHLARHVQALLGEVMVSAACHALHAAARLARWLLLVQDRAGGPAALPLTQEFLALMLGLQRTTVTETASALQRAGLIAYRRGSVE